MSELHPDEIAADKEHIRRHGLKGFCEVFWPVLQPEELLWNWHADAVVEHLEAVTRGEIRNMLFCMPPGCMKSLLISIFWPAWEWTIRPDEKYVFSSYSEEMTFELADKSRRVIQDAKYVAMFPKAVLRKDQNRISKFENESFGFRISTTPGGTVTGKHGTRNVFDDLSKAQDASGRALFEPTNIKKANDFWFGTMSSRVSTPSRHANVGVMQRLHHEDTAGKCIEKGYHTLILPMEFGGVQRSTSFIDPRKVKGELLWPARFSAEFLASIKENLSVRDSAAQYDQDPTPPGGNVFKEEWFRTWGREDSIKHKILPHGMMVFQSWDCAFKGKATSDFVVGQVWGFHNNDFLLLAQYKGQWTFSETRDAMRLAAKEWPQTVTTYVEDKANGTAVMDELRREIMNFAPVNPDGGKDTRANAIEPMVRNGAVYIPCPIANPWVREFLTEAKNFPYAKNDDQVDAFTQAIVNFKSGGSLVAFYAGL